MFNGNDRGLHKNSSWPKRIDLLLGVHTISWLAFYIIWYWVAVVRRRHTLDNGPRRISGIEWVVFMQDFYREYEHILAFRVRDLEVAHLLGQESLGAVGVAELTPAERLIFESRLIFCVAAGEFAMTRLASNPKDYVYGMSALSGLRIPADYSPARSVGQVYCDFVQYWFLALSRHPRCRRVEEQAFCALWVLRSARVGHL